LVSVVKMATVLQEGTREQQRSVVRFFFCVGIRAQCKPFADDEEVETEARKWLRQRSKDFYAARLLPRLCCYLVIHIETVLYPLQLFYFHLWFIY
jgi:hypothetical protein